MPEVRSPIAPAIDLTDESFDAEKAKSYHLSLLTDENSFSFAILDTNTNKYVVIRSDIRIPLSGIELLKNNFKSVSCSVAHTKFTLIPAALFDEENKGSLLGFNHGVNHDEKIIFNNLHNLNAKNIFTLSKKIADEIQGEFPKVDFLHSSTSFIEGLLVQNKNNAGKKVFSNFYPHYFEVAILDGRELLFSNAFQYKTPEDIAYYILFLYEQLHLNTETIELSVSGDIEKSSPQHSLLFNYIRNVKFASFPESFSYSYKFDELPSHRFFSLFNQYLCA